MPVESLYPHYVRMRSEIKLAAVCIVFLAAFVGLATWLPFSDDSDTIIYGRNWLSPSDPFPASSIAANNLAPDGGGMSPNDEDLTQVRLVPAWDSVGSDGDSSAVSSDTLLLFRTQRDGSQTPRLSYFDGKHFTPPTQLRAPDMRPGEGLQVGGR